MFVVIVYDVGVERVAKVCHFLRQYLNWVQNSVFEGELTNSEFQKVKLSLKELINTKTDSVLIYMLSSEKFLKQEHIGIKKVETSSVI